MVVADDAVTAQDFVHQLLPVQAVLQCQTHIGIVEGRHVDMHGEGVVKGSRRFFQLHPRAPLQHVHGLQIRGG